MLKYADQSQAGNRIEITNLIEIIFLIAEYNSENEKITFTNLKLLN